jgi:hypothetical protein
MTSGRREDGGIPRRQQRVVVPLGSPSGKEDWRDANQAKAEKLLRNDLRRRAGVRGLELRQSAYGYALIDSARRHVDDRSDMTLDEVAGWLDQALE